MTDVEFISSLEVEKPGRLTFQLENLAEVHPHSVNTLNTLIQFATHQRPIVREGAVLGLMILSDNGVKEADSQLYKVSIGDPSDTIRSMAESWLQYKIDNEYF